MKKSFTSVAPAALIAGTLLFILLLQGCVVTGADPEQTADTANQIPAICESLDSTLIKEILETENYTVDTLGEISDGAEGCKYIDSTGKSDSAKNFNFIHRVGENPAQTKNGYFSAVNIWQNSALENREYSYHENLGDGAFFAYSLKTPQMVAYKNNTLLVITFGNLGKDRTFVLEKAITLAETLFNK